MVSSMQSWAHWTSPIRAMRKQRGWIGIDIGTRAIKVAQVQRAGSKLRIGSRWCLRDKDQLLTREDFLQGFAARIPELRRIKGLFRGQRCSLVLPMSIIDLRVQEVPAGKTDEQRRMIGSEMAAELQMELDEFSFDAWQVENDSFQDSGLMKMAVLALKKPLAAETSRYLLSAGLECQALDGTPCALARAVTMTDWAKPEEPVAAIDLGYTSPMVVLVLNGRPLFSRMLRGCGFRGILESLTTALRISDEESQYLLCRYGLPGPGEKPAKVSQTTLQLIEGQLAHLMTEIGRTLDYIRHQFRDKHARRVCLFGGGALIRNLTEYVGQRLHIPVHSWQLDPGGEGSEDPLYGVAASLSSLAWETGKCT